MLILTRKIGESFLIGNDIEIKVTDVSGDKIRIGIDAPSALKILRKELVLTIEENQEAAKGSPPQKLKEFLQDFH